jgi:hypothetical protein
VGFTAVHLDLPVFLEGTPDQATWLERHERCRRLFTARLARDRALAGEGPVVVVLAGGTNVGKSTIFNALCGEPVSAASPLARGTKQAVLWGAGIDRAVLERAGGLSGYRAVEIESPEAALAGGAGRQLLARWHDATGWNGVAMLDTPDIDSAFEANRTVAEDFCWGADVLCFVTSAEKYHDEVGVDFLSEAVRLGKRVVVVPNKFDDAEALADLRGRVLASAGAAPDTVVVAVPPLPAEERDGGSWVDPVRAALLQAAVPEARAAASAGAVKAFRADFGAVLGAAEAQAKSVRDLQAAAAAIAVAESAMWRSTIENGRFFELERVYRDVLLEMRIPLIDDFYGALGRFWGHVRRIMPGAEEDPLARKIAERKAQERDAAKAASRKAFDAREVLGETYHGRLGAAARTLVPGSPPPETISADIDRFLEEQDRVSDTWVAEKRAEMLATIKAHPSKARLLTGLRAALQLGPGVLVAMLTGGLGADLVSLAISDRVMKLLIDALGGRVYLRELRKEFLDRRATAFAAFLQERVAAPIAAGEAAPVEPGAFAAARAALESLEAR